MNILDDIKTSLSPQQIDHLAGAIGETPGATQMAMTGTLPALLGGFAKEGETPQGAAELIERMRNLPFVSALGDLLGSKDDKLEKSGESMIGHMFGGQLPGIANGIAHFAGIRGASAQYLMAMTAPVVLGGVARAAPPGGYSPQSLMGELESQKSYIAKALPSGLSGLAGFIGIPGLTRAAQRASAAEARKPSEARRWVPWTVLALALVAVLFGVKAWTPSRSGIELPSASMRTVTLPGGATIDVPYGSMPYQLSSFLSGNDPAPRRFTFDHLSFDTSTAALTADSRRTIDAVATILKAYPDAVVRVEGFTDSQGDDGMNQNLSRRRAQTVADAIVAGGVDRSRATAAGLGKESPVADNSTEAGRAKNRRVELVVTRK